MNDKSNMDTSIDVDKECLRRFEGGALLVRWVLGASINYFLCEVDATKLRGKPRILSRNIVDLLRDLAVPANEDKVRLVSASWSPPARGLVSLGKRPSVGAWL